MNAISRVFSCFGSSHNQAPKERISKLPLRPRVGHVQNRPDAKELCKFFAYHSEKNFERDMQEIHAIPRSAPPARRPTATSSNRPRATQHTADDMRRKKEAEDEKYRRRLAAEADYQAELAQWRCEEQAAFYNNFNAMGAYLGSAYISPPPQPMPPRYY